MNRILTLAMALVIVLAAVSACGASYGSVEDLADAAGCAETQAPSDTAADGEVLGCTLEDGVETLYVGVFPDDDARDEHLEMLRNLPDDGTSERYVVYNDDWMVECFSADVCGDIQKELGGELERFE